MNKKKMGAISDVNDSISIFSALRKLYLIGKVKAKKHLQAPYRVQRLADDVFQRRIPFESTVCVEGFLLPQGSTFRPSTYCKMNTTGHKKTISPGFDFANNRAVVKAVEQFKFRTFQFPTQILPPLKLEETYQVLFLYPSEFPGFILEENNEKQSASDRLNIHDMHCPLMTLLRKEDAANLSYKKVKLVGKISLIPDELTETLLAGFCPTRKEFSRHYLRPGPSIIQGFCLDCRDPASSDFEDIDELKTLVSPIYVEGHFNTEASEIIKSIRGKDKDLFHFSFSVRDEKALKHCFGGTDISIISIPNGTFGFYTETDILDYRRYEADLNELIRVYRKFVKLACNNTKTPSGALVKFSPDFLYDFEKQSLFHPNGILTDPTITKNNTQDAKDTISWLKGEEEAG